MIPLYEVSELSVVLHESSIIYQTFAQNLPNLFIQIVCTTGHKQFEGVSRYY